MYDFLLTTLGFVLNDLYFISRSVACVLFFGFFCFFGVFGYVLRTDDLFCTLCICINLLFYLFICSFKGHIAIDSSVFPSGTPGFVLDVKARCALWEVGLDYRHGKERYMYYVSFIMYNVWCIILILFVDLNKTCTKSLIKIYSQHSQLIFLVLSYWKGCCNACDPIFCPYGKNAPCTPVIEQTFLKRLYV